MLTEQRISTALESWCPGCGRAYSGASLPFLYADELGARCPGCGSILIVGNDGNPRRREPGPCRLVLAEGLEGSPLHGKLAELAEGEEGVRVLVDRTSETRTVHLVSAVPAMAPSPKKKRVD